MGFSYLMDKNGSENTWEQITRDERTFCMHLYMVFKDNAKGLLEIIKKSRPISSFENKLKVEGKEWKLAYEVCYYRDLLFTNDVAVKGDASLIEKWGVPRPEKLIKRTFDLMLYSESEIIIIEAKAAEGLTSEQFYDFVKDKAEVKMDGVKEGKYIVNIINGLNDRDGLKRKIPVVKLVILASSEYYRSSSFSLTNEKGVGRKCILETKYVDALVSWSEIAREMEPVDSLDHEMILRADHVYSEKIGK